jgi:hypothetical protein
MNEVQRYDVVELGKPKRFQNGWMRADAYLTRPGVFEYLESDGRIRRELRTPEEVFDASSIATLELVPVTLRHPRGDGGEKIMLDAHNTKLYAVGHSSEAVTRENDRVRNTLMITDEAAVAAVDSGVRQISCGYRCDCEEKPGKTQGIKSIPDGLEYDAIQRNIRYNHVALEPIGRAGPDIGIRLDAGDVVVQGDTKPAPTSPENPRTDGGPAMAKIRLDGVDYDAPEQLAQAIAANQQKQAQKVEALEAEVKTRNDAVEAKDQELAAKGKELDKEKARADAAEADARKAKEELAEASKPERISAAVRERVFLERQAGQVLGEEAKFDEMDEGTIKRAVVAKVYAHVKLDGKSNDYVQALYERALDASDDESQTRTDRAELERALGKGGEGKDPQRERRDAADESAKKQSEEWKKPLTASKGQ